MKTRIFTVAILVPAFIILTTTPANAISAASWRVSSGRR